jgi:hypothetical protein
MSAQPIRKGSTAYRIALGVVAAGAFLIGGAAGYVAKSPAAATRYVYVGSYQSNPSADACTRADGHKAC